MAGGKSSGGGAKAGGKGKAGKGAAGKGAGGGGGKGGGNGGKGGKRAAPAPVSHEDGVPAGTRQGKDAEDAALGHAAGGCSTAAAPEAAEPSESYHLAKRPRPAVAAESMSDATVHDQQVVEDPPRGAIPPLPVPSATHVLPRKPISSLRPLFPDCHR